MDDKIKTVKDFLNNEEVSHLVMFIGGMWAAYTIGNTFGYLNCFKNVKNLYPELAKQISLFELVKHK